MPQEAKKRKSWSGTSKRASKANVTSWCSVVNKWKLEGQNALGNVSPRVRFQIFAFSASLKTQMDKKFCDVNPWTPVLPLTGRDEPRPFFYFWRHHFWPNGHHLYSTSAGGKDFSNDAQIGVIGRMEKKDKKDEWKTRTKTSCHYTWLLHGKNCLSWLCFLRRFLTVSKPSIRSITAAKRKEKEKKEGCKKIQNSKA